MVPIFRVHLYIIKKLRGCTERLDRVLSYFYSVFSYIESKGILDVSNDTDVFGFTMYSFHISIERYKSFS